MSAKIRGRAVIINNRYIVNSTKCVGPEYDVANLKLLFESLHFDVANNIHTNIDAQEIERVIDEEARTDHSAYDAFILFVMSHGEHGYVLGMDDRPVEIDRLIEKIGSIQSLHNKPKMVFIQARRREPGVRKQRPKDCPVADWPYVAGPDINYVNESGMRKLEESLENAKFAAQPPATLAGYRDIFVAYSTMPGFYSYRKEDFGSYFVQFFVHVCSTRAHEEDLSGIMLSVNRLLGLRPKAVNFEQIGEAVHRGLSKQIYFFPKYQV